MATKNKLREFLHWKKALKAKYYNEGYKAGTLYVEERSKREYNLGYTAGFAKGIGSKTILADKKKSDLDK